MNFRRFLPIRNRVHGRDFLLTFLAVAVTTAVLLSLRASLSNQVIALLYLLPVMLSATRWGLLPALTASLTSFFAFNFFFLFPTFTFAVGNTEELLVLIVFLIVAVIISQAVASANLHAIQAENREREATTLYALSRALEEQPGLEDTLASVARMITDAFATAGCEVATWPKLVPARARQMPRRAPFGRWISRWRRTRRRWESSACIFGKGMLRRMRPPSAC
jgi:K+-sensing histidine kinase KdpD